MFKQASMVFLVTRRKQLKSTNKFTLNILHTHLSAKVNNKAKPHFNPEDAERL